MILIGGILSCKDAIRSSPEIQLLFQWMNELWKCLNFDKSGVKMMYVSYNAQSWVMMCEFQQQFAYMINNESNNELIWAIMGEYVRWWMNISVNERLCALIGECERWWANMCNIELSWFLMSVIININKLLWANLNVNGRLCASMSKYERWWANKSVDERNS